MLRQAFLKACPANFDMKLIVLAAGYATRLYPLTKNLPKPLLSIAGRPMLECLLAATKSIRSIDQIIVITNARFAAQFENWAANADTPFPTTILNDRTTNNDNRLGAIGDLHKCIKEHLIDDDVIVIAGDNLFTESIGDFGSFCAGKPTPCVGVYNVSSLEEAAKYGVVTIDDSARITSFEEKPKLPKSTLISVALYYYPRTTLSEIDRYLAEGNNPDQPGQLIQWLYPQTTVRTWPIPGQWLDIGSHETLAEAQKIFEAM